MHVEADVIIFGIRIQIAQVESEEVIGLDPPNDRHLASSSRRSRACGVDIGDRGDDEDERNPGVEGGGI